MISRTSLAALTIAAFMTGPVSLVAAQTADAESPAKETEVDTPRERRPGVLAGPKVRDAQAPGGEFSGKGRMRPKQHDVRPQVWLKVVQELELSEAQQANIKNVVEEMYKEGAEWKQKFAGQMRSLNQQMQGYRERKETPPQELVDKRRELRESAPDFAQYRERVMKELTEEQKTALQDKIKQRQEEMRKRRVRMMRDGAGQSGEGNPPARQRRQGRPQMNDQDSPVSKDAPNRGDVKKKTTGGDPMRSTP